MPEAKAPIRCSEQLARVLVRNGHLDESWPRSRGLALSCAVWHL